MKIENLLPLLVPATFIALYLITSIFNRDAQPLPARKPKSLGPGFDPRAPRPYLPPRGSMGAGQVGSPGSTAARAVPPLREPDMVIQDVRTSTPLKEAEAALRRFTKSRKKSAAKLATTDASKSTSAGMSRSMGESIGDTVGSGLGLSPLALPPSPLLHQDVDPLSTYSRASVSTSKGPTTRDIDIKALVASPARLQEAWILSEILGPPLSLRGRGKGRS